MIDRSTNTSVMQVAGVNSSARPAPADPAAHQAAERQFIESARRLLTDSRLTVDTVGGRRSVKNFNMKPGQGDRAVELKRLMSDMDRPDRELQSRMPVGEWLEATYWKRRWLVFPRVVARLLVVCVSPTRSLIAGSSVARLSAADVHRLLKDLPSSQEPITIVLVGTAGFEPEARELAERTARRTLVLAEPNQAGGWSLYGTPQTQALCELLDPEAQQQKSQRLGALIAGREIDLAGGGLAADQLATAAAMPVAAVETELRAYARAHPGLAAKRLGGRLVLFREGTTSPASVASGGESMPFIDRIKALFARKGETEKKIAFLSERRAELSQQRDRAYEEISQLETRDQEFRDQFKSARAPLTKRRVTGQLVQLRKDVQRRHQMIEVLNQQVNVVSTHLHNLELVRQGKLADLPNSETLADDAAAAEEMLAELQAQTELADTTAAATGSPVTGGMSAEEAALFAELEAEDAGPAAKADAPPAASQAANQPIAKVTQAPPPVPAPAKSAAPARNRPDNSAAEPG